MATPEEMAQTMLENLEEKTGRTILAWKKLLEKEKFEKHGQIVKYLKSEHGVTHGFANLIAHETLLTAAGHASSEDLVAAQYGGAKAGLKPIYDKLIQAIEEFGDDVEVSPKKTSVSLRRKKQFALIKPATRTRMDIGIQLKGDPAQGRLVECKSASMTSHQVSIEDPKGVDKELLAWLKDAYTRAG